MGPFNCWLLLFTCFGLAAVESKAVYSLDIHPPQPAIQRDQRLLLESRHEKGHGKRGTVPSALDYDPRYQQYTANFTFGTPPQSFSLSIAISQGDTILNPPTSPSCAKSNCMQYGTYSPNASSTYSALNTAFNYTTGGSFDEYAIGNYGTDTAWIGNNTIPDFQFAVSYNSTFPFGTLGLGYPIQEMQVLQSHKQPYANFPQALANLGLINSNAYSLWLKNGEPSSILFGGVDSGKYTGELRTIAITPITASQLSVVVPLTDVRFANTSLMDGGWNMSIAVDPGFTQTWLPPNMTSILFPMVSGISFDSNGIARIDCAQADNQTVMELTVAWPQWSVPLSELVLPDPNGGPHCVFGIQNAAVLDYPYTLGMTVLGSAYIVFDLANGELSIAQTSFNATMSNIAEINSGIDGVPGAVRAPTSTPSVSHGLTSGAIAGIAVGAAAAVGLASLLGYMMFFRRRKRRRLAEDEHRNKEKSESAVVDPQSPNFKSMLAKSEAADLRRGSKELNEAPDQEIYEAEGPETKPPVELPVEVPVELPVETPVEMPASLPGFVAELEDTSVAPLDTAPKLEDALSKS